MTQEQVIDWQEANQSYLVAALADVREALARHAGEADSHLRPPAGPTQAQESPVAAGAAGLGEGARLQGLAGRITGRPDDGPPEPGFDRPPALERLCALLGLSSFERALVLLCAGIELDATFAPLCAAAQGDPAHNYPTFSLALAALPGAHWSALAPGEPLRRWQIIQVEPGRSVTRSALRLDERVLHYLAGIDELDERVAGLVRPLRPPEALPGSHQALARELAAGWSSLSGDGLWPALQICGGRPATQQAIAAAACDMLGLDLYLMPAQALAPGGLEAERMMRLWEREAVLSGCALLLDCAGVDRADAVANAAINRLVETCAGLLMLAVPEPRGPWARTVLSFDTPRPPAAEQRALWAAMLGETAGRLDGSLEQLVTHFDLDAAGMAAAWAGAHARLAAAPDAADGASLAGALWDACRAQARPAVEDLAQRIEAAADWDDLVLPDPQRALLREIGIQVRQRSRVYETWGFAGKSNRGLGISALFAGPSGTGKTMAAEVLARELRLDLYRIDLSQVVSKYIGETEKNLRRVFDAAEAAGSVLLFDEADALFGKRSEVKDSHDRYANIEVGYLLQRMEAYRGLAILTTNLQDSLDTAFVRRIRFIVQFPFPDAAQRAEIWRRVFPTAAPTEGLDPARLARLSVAGGNIRNVALYAAFLAAEAGEPIRMSHLLAAARREYEKLERVLTEGEVRDWI